MYGSDAFFRHSPESTRVLDAKCCENLESYADAQGAPMCKPDNNRARGSFIQGDDDVGGRTHLEGRAGGDCERFKFVGGRDHAALSSDVGLYLKFGVDQDGFPICDDTFERWTELRDRGKAFGENERKPDQRTDRFINGRFASDAIPHMFEGNAVTDQPCGLNDYQGNPDERPLHEIVEYFADDQEAWAGLFAVSIQKMLSNGVGLV
jgi:hypothetical protein